MKYISDAFDQKHTEIASQPHADAEDRLEYEADRVFWVPKTARWSELQKAAKQPRIGKLVDAAMEIIEKENRDLRGTLPILLTPKRRRRLLSSIKRRSWEST